MAGSQPMVLPSTSDKRPSVTDFDSIIRIKVGQTSPEIFEIHKGVLKFYSGYFRKAIENIESGRFAEAGDKTITLAEVDSCTFRFFQGWVYTRELPKFGSSMILVKLWCFGDQRTVPLLQNEAIDALCDREWATKFMSFTLDDVYENTVPGSALRKFMIAAFAALSTSENFTPNLWPVEASHDLIRHLLDVRPRLVRGTEFKERDTCEWHVHEEGTRCQQRPIMSPQQTPTKVDTSSLKIPSGRSKASSRAATKGSS